jgi:hypothetical protein
MTFVEERKGYQWGIRVMSEGQMRLGSASRAIRAAL